MAEKRDTPLLEWIAAAVGLLVLLFTGAVIGREAVGGGWSDPPQVEIAVQEVTQAGSGFLVRFAAVNRGGGTAAALTVEGQLMRGGQPVETSTATIDYAPGRGRAEGGLYFRNDPRGAELVVRATGYQRP
jgi:uncharacterized protein (TIGR02588 family)